MRVLSVIAALTGTLLTACGTTETHKAAEQQATDGMTVSDAVLVAPKSGGATLSATIENHGRDDLIRAVSARRGAQELSVYYLEGGLDYLSKGKRVVLNSAANGSATIVVRGVEPGQTVQVTLTFTHAPKADLNVPVVADGPEYRNVAVYRHLPTITHGRFVVRPGQRCAFVGYTVDSHGDFAHASLDDITVTAPDGKDIAWKHVTAAGGPSDFVAFDKPTSIEPADWAPNEVCDEPGNGDADYIEASEVRVGQTVEVAIQFEAGVVRAPFKIVAG